MIFHHNSNSMEISFHSHPSCCPVNAMKFCTWHDSCAIVACAKFYSNKIPYKGVTLKTILNQIGSTMEKLFVKWAPEQNGRHFAGLIFKSKSLPGPIVIQFINGPPGINGLTHWGCVMHIYISEPESSLVQVMACCLFGRPFWAHLS